MKQCRLAVVVPCFNEEAVLHETNTRLTALLADLADKNKIAPGSFILYVDDGSTDSTWGLIERFHAENPSVRGLKLARNVGHQNALMAGLTTVTGICDAAVSIDADLQDDVSVMEEMVDQYSHGHGIVYGVRKLRTSDTFFKRTTALGFYRLMRSLGVDTVHNHADYRLLSGPALEHLEQFKERNLFLRGIIPLIGLDATSVYYDRHERFAGSSKYPVRKMLNFAVDGITSFSIKPVRYIALTGIILCLLSVVAALYVFTSYFQGHVVRGWTSLMLSVWFLGSVILISIGVVGEYVGKLYMEVKARPRYIVEKELIDD